MGYLNGPRLHFSGYFQADVSTVNNDVRHFDSAAFQPNYQLPQSSPNRPDNGWWNPEGSGAFRFVQCVISGGVLDGRTLDSDPAFGSSLIDSDGRVSGKLVDLDPQQQAVSEIWGHRVRLSNQDGTQDLFRSDFRVTPFMDLWRRQQGDSGGDQTLAAYYQSVLEQVEWSDTVDSPLLAALRDASSDGLLSIKFNVFGYKLDSTSPEFTLGNLVGTIGPACPGEPARFVLGRHMMATLSNPTAPAQNVYNFSCVVDRAAQRITADLGNALPISDGEGTLKDIGSLQLGVLGDASAANGDLIAADGIALLDPVPYQDSGWYQRTAGVVDLSYAGNAGVEAKIASAPLALVTPADAGQFRVLIREGLDGLYLRADQYVARLDPGASASFDFYATKYGQPFSGAMQLSHNSRMVGGGGGPLPLVPPVPVPPAGTPTSAIDFPASLDLDAAGRATLTVKAAEGGPGNPRGYIDGQVYGVGYQLAAQPAGYASNPWLFLSLLAWDAIEPVAEPTWYRDIEPILQQYGNLYPIMSKHLVDLGDYQSVVEHRALLKLVFSLPVSDPNYMPVTRDLSTAKRELLLEWLGRDGPNGLPLKGHSGQRGLFGRAKLEAQVAALRASAGAQAQAAAKTAAGGGKTAFLESLQRKSN